MARSAFLDRAPRHKEYATIKVTLAQRTDKAVLLDRTDLGAPVWVRKIDLEVISRIAVDRAVRGAEIEIQIELKTAEEKGLLPKHS